MPHNSFKQTGQITIIILIFILLLGTLFSFKNSKKATSQIPLSTTPGGCIPFTGPNPPQLTAYATHGEEDDDNKSTYRSNIPGIKPYLTDLGINPDKQANYKLILKNVPILTSYLNENIKVKTGFDGLGLPLNLSPSSIKEINGKKYYLMYPSVHGEIKIKYPGLLKPAQMGLVFLAHTDSGGNPLTIQNPARRLDKDSNNYLVTDIYQDETKILSDPLPQLAIDICQGKDLPPSSNQPAASSIPPGQSIVFPTQNTSPDKKELQLEYFLLNEVAEDSTAGFWNIHCKPALYLYPPEKIAVNVKVFPQGYLTLTIPQYQIDGWSGTAFPDGTIIVDNKSYPYLYYEAKIKDRLIKKPTTGFVRPTDKLAELFQDLLPRLGLNPVQTADFISYWTNALPDSPYYFVGIMDQSNIDLLEPLKITPKPDSINRVHLYFEPLKTPLAVPSPVITSPLMSGFKAVEWGGLIKTDQNHPYTCSQ